MPDAETITLPREAVEHLVCAGQAQICGLMQTAACHTLPHAWQQHLWGLADALNTAELALGAGLKGDEDR